MSDLKKGQAVTASTIRGQARSGTYVATHPTPKGDWIEVAPADGSANFKTRPALVKPA